jgi:hemoglobin
VYLVSRGGKFLCAGWFGGRVLTLPQVRTACQEEICATGGLRSILDGMSIVLGDFPLPVTPVEISKLVDAFYTKVQRDSVIGPIFNAQVKDWPAHLALLKEFWASVLLGTGSFRGNPLETHLKLPLSREHFERWLALFAETALELLPPEQAEIFISKSERIAETFQRGMAARRGGAGILSGSE